MNKENINNHRDEQENPEAILWTTPNCMGCKMSKRKLAELAINFVVKDLSDEENADTLDRFKEMGLISAPILQTKDGYISGFQPDLYKKLKDQDNNKKQYK